MKMNPKLNSFILNIFNKNLLVASYLCISLCLSVCSFILCSFILYSLPYVTRGIQKWLNVIKG